MEKHMKIHNVSEEHECDICGKRFILEWRLKMHRKAHDMTDQKYCHFFNNKKSCPYEEIGCMFKHEPSQQCQLQQQCSNKLCQYMHDCADVQENLFECEYCEFKSESYSPFLDHINKNHLESDEEDDEPHI